MSYRLLGIKVSLRSIFFFAKQIGKWKSCIVPFPESIHSFHWMKSKCIKKYFWSMHICYLWKALTNSWVRNDVKSFIYGIYKFDLNFLFFFDKNIITSHLLPLDIWRINMWKLFYIFDNLGMYQIWSINLFRKHFFHCRSQNPKVGQPRTFFNLLVQLWKLNYMKIKVLQKKWLTKFELHYWNHFNIGEKCFILL